MVVGLFLSFANFYMKMEKRKWKNPLLVELRSSQFPFSPFHFHLSIFAFA